MGAEVKILIEGFTNAELVPRAGQEKTQPTITLVKEENLIMVVDPGTLDNQQTLIEALKKENLTVDDFNLVCLTHSHIDHYRNAGMFPKAKVLEYYGLWDGNKVESWSEELTPNITILHTPGHDYSSITVFVTTGPESIYPGVVAICGDVFWRKDYPKDPHDDIFASNAEKLAQSRELILKKADWIIPGHGPAYENEHKDNGEKKERNNKTNNILLKFLEKTKNNNEIVGYCRKCRSPIKNKDRCQCRKYLCYRCCECDLDCDNCSCSHRRR